MTNTYIQDRIQRGKVAYIIFAILLVVIFVAVKIAGVQLPITTLEQPSPEQAALVALGDVARTDAQAIVADKLAVIVVLSQQAEAQPSIMRNAGWREQWTRAWQAVANNSTGEMRAASTTCAVAGITGLALDMVQCSKQSAKALKGGI